MIGNIYRPPRTDQLSMFIDEFTSFLVSLNKSHPKDTNIDLLKLKTNTHYGIFP